MHVGITMSGKGELTLDLNVLVISLRSTMNLDSDGRICGLLLRRCSRKWVCWCGCLGWQGTDIQRIRAE